MSDELVIDGAAGEGGGQVLRTSLCLSLVSGRPFVLERIRAGRKRPGLRAQHLTCVRAAAAVGGAEVEGARQDGQRLRFVPRGLHAGDTELDVGTAGSTSLVLQTVLPALATLDQPSRLDLRGGTHAALAPPFEFLREVYLPLLARMGAPVVAELQRPGFYPKGGGRVRYAVEPTGRLRPLELLERGALRAVRARALVSGLPLSVAVRELDVVADELGWPAAQLSPEEVRAKGPGNALLLALEHEHARELVSAFGSKGVPAEQVAREACAEARTYLESGAPVGQHLADQLVLLFALAGGGRLRTLPLTLHTETQLELIPRFLPVRIARRDLEDGTVELSVGRA